MIEDIQYLQEHSAKESYIFFVDSKDRDYTLYPTPQSYRINFSAPFKHVYSLEILDASIPRTQYCVDTHNNSLRFCVVNSSTYNWYDISIPIRDYGDATLISAFNSALSDHAITVKNESSPADELSTFVFESRKEFHFDMNNSTIFKTLGFDLHASEEDSDRYKTLASYANDLTYVNSLTDKTYSTFDTKEYLEDIAYYKQRWYGSIPGDDVIDTVFELPQTDSISINTVDYIIRQQFEVNDSGMLHILNIPIADISENLLKSDSNTHLQFQILKGTIEVYGNTLTYNSETLSLNYTFTSSHPIDIETEYVLKIYSSLVKEEGNVEFNVNNDHVDKATLEIPSGIAPLNLPKTQTYSICFDVMVKNGLQQIKSPGLYNLIGDRYILLKCKEIEDHLFRSRAYEKYTMGLAKFNIGLFGYDETRFDFSSTPPREFHPIGKLTNLTFNFHRPDGSLYNFRGINHTLTIVIRYYEPVQNLKFEKSSLNPKYDPDTFRYIQNKHYLTDSDLDDDDE